MTQQLAHHTINGCNLRPGDLLGTGTISGPVRFFSMNLHSVSASCMSLQSLHALFIRQKGL